MTKARLAELEREARAVVAAAVQQLPPEVRAHASALPVLMEAHPGPEAPFDDCLGLFIGDPIGTADADRDALPARIFLYLVSLWEEANGSPDVFQDEVRITYLHELGHYLGWDEEDLEARGLE